MPLTSLGSVCEVSSKKRVLPSWMVNLEETASNKKAKKIKPVGSFLLPLILFTYYYYIIFIYILPYYY